MPPFHRISCLTKEEQEKARCCGTIAVTSFGIADRRNEGKTGYFYIKSYFLRNSQGAVNGGSGCKRCCKTRETQCSQRFPRCCTGCCRGRFWRFTGFFWKNVNFLVNKVQLESFFSREELSGEHFFAVPYFFSKPVMKRDTVVYSKADSSSWCRCCRVSRLPLKIWTGVSSKTRGIVFHDSPLLTRSPTKRSLI